MTKRGKVLRDTTSGPGLLMIEGQQYRFSREEAWKSEATPKPGLVVDVEMDARGKVHSISVVPEAQLAREQAEAARPRERKAKVSLLATIGSLRLAAAALLVVAWILPTAVSIQIPFPGKLELTFWQTLGFVNRHNVPLLMDGKGGNDAGLYGLAAAVVLAGPLLPRFWKDKRAILGGLLPLGFMIVVGIAAHSSLQIALGGTGGGGHAAKTLSLGPGAYVSISIGLLFAFLFIRDLLATRVVAKQELDSPQRKAA